jgi:hypothetical protein
MNLQWTPINIILQDFTTAMKPASLLYSTNTQKCLELKGRHQISSLQSAEWGSLVTLVTCMSPTGHFVSPFPVFPRKNMKQELINDTTPGSIHTCHPSGWIQNENFIQWFLHFIKHTNPTKEDPVILELNGHYSHTRNLEAITLA